MQPDRLGHPWGRHASERGHLKLLEGEGMVRLKQEDTIVVFITAAGIEKINSELIKKRKMHS